MTATPVLILVSAAVLLGLYLGLLFLRGERRQGLIALHLLLGFGGLESFIMLLHGTPDGAAAQPGSYGMVAAALFGGAGFIGFTAPLLRRSPIAANMMLAAHVGVGALGFALFLAWVASV
jgi:hypothetical protein